MCSLKDLRTGEQVKVPVDGLAGVVKQRLINNLIHILVIRFILDFQHC